MLVRARGRRWRIERVSPGDDCCGLALSTADDLAHGPRSQVLLTPFDRLIPLDSGPDRMRVAPWHAALSRLRFLARAASRFDESHAAAAARMDLHSWQLEPALALALGRTSRLVLADHVGLGKTVQAGLCIAELTERGLLTRTLAITPASLRHQWAGELAARFGIGATVCDADWLAERVRALPATVNPWLAAGVFIVSMDFIKRIEVLRGLEDGVWDLLVVDEAHLAGADTSRARAIGAIARRARRVLLATATPHDGDAARFRALCNLGALDQQERVLFIRRSRRAVGMDTRRRVHLLQVSPGPEDRHLDDLFQRYIDSGRARARSVGRERKTGHGRAQETPSVERSGVCRHCRTATAIARACLIRSRPPSRSCPF